MIFFFSLIKWKRETDLRATVHHPIKNFYNVILIRRFGRKFININYYFLNESSYYFFKNQIEKYFFQLTLNLF